MQTLKNLFSKRVFYYFGEISKIPHGSGDMQEIADYCVGFAQKHSLRYYLDDAKNVIVYKPATKGFEKAEPVILQGHLDMVCQKTADSKIDFLRDGLELYLDGDFLKAKGTTLGADNGIAVAMILSILESDEFSHPEIEAVFTTDEEIGMLGATALDMSKLNAKRMINLDSEDEGVVTVSCAGGADVKIILPILRQKKNGAALKLTLCGLLGGHSGVDINKNRLNADILMGRILNEIAENVQFDIISVNGGDKVNAITNRCEAVVLTQNEEELINEFNTCLEQIKTEINSFENGFEYDVLSVGSGEFNVMDRSSTSGVIFALCQIPNGIIKMSEDIENLVETSLNLGILKTEENAVIFNSALRSNKEADLRKLMAEMVSFAEKTNAESYVSGYYPPWEYRASSPLRETYKAVYKRLYNKDAKCEAIHAGLECAVFASRIEDIDCIAIGPTLCDVHTVNEKADIYSIDRTYKLLLEILGDLK
ncbi:MAG: aminoacyl-histidine dipeptidase [Clostridia bacterium]|nr:aminoacyl-histidine dipeptidase [Clostridia bacterium]